MPCVIVKSPKCPGLGTPISHVHVHTGQVFTKWVLHATEHSLERVPRSKSTSYKMVVNLVSGSPTEFSLETMYTMQIYRKLTLLVGKLAKWWEIFNFPAISTKFGTMHMYIVNLRIHLYDMYERFCFICHLQRAETWTQEAHL